MTHSVHIRTKRFETEVAEKQCHMDWYAKECQSIDIDTPEETEDYQKRYYALMRERTEVQCKYTRHLRKQIAQLKQQAIGNSEVRRRRNQLKKRYFQLQTSGAEARTALLQLGPNMV